MGSIDVTAIKDAIHAWVVAGSGLPADRVRWGGYNVPQPDDITQAWISMRISSVRQPGSDWNRYEDAPLTFADKTITGLDAGTDVGTIPTHGLNTGDGPVRLETSGSLVGSGLATATDYWWIKLTDNTFKLAATFLDAVNPTPVPVDITGVGTGTHKVVDTADTRRAGAELTENVEGNRVVTVTITCFPPQPADDSTEAVAILSDVVAEAGKKARGEALSDAHIGLFSVGDPQANDGVLNAVYFEPRATMTVVFSTKSAVTATETYIESTTVENDDTDETFDVPAPDVADTRRLIVIFGDSNAVGQGSTDQADNGFTVTTPYTSVVHNATYATGVVDPPTMIDVSTRALQPYAVGASPGFGLEIMLGRDLHQEGLLPYIAKFAINGTTADDYKPASTYPSTGGNLLARLFDYIDARIAEWGIPLSAVVASLGTNDASDATKASDYGTNITAVFDAIRSRYGEGVAVILPKIPATAAPTYTSTVRAAQVSYVSTDPLCVLIDNDDLTLTDGYHFNADGYLSLGQRTAYAYTDVKAWPLRRITTAYAQPIGREVVAHGAGALTPLTWPGVKVGDREVLVVATGLVDEAALPGLSTSAGFVQITGVTSEAFGTLDNNLVFWERVVDQAMLDANGGRTPSPVVADNNNVNAAWIFTIRGPSPSPTVDAFATSKNDDYNTSLTVTGVTTSSANELVLRVVTGYSGSGANSLVVADPGLTGLTEFHDGVYSNGGSDYQMISLTWGVKTAAGATGNATATTASQAVLTGATLAIVS